MLLRLVPVDSLLASCLVVLVPLSRRFRYGLSYCFCHLQRFECETELPARLWGSYEITQHYLGRVVAALLCARLCLSVDRTPSAFLLLRERAVCPFRPRPRDVFSLWENSVTVISRTATWRYQDWPVWPDLRPFSFEQRRRPNTGSPPAHAL